jgi:hypothetical protein
MSEQKQVNFTIVPDESGDKSRTYSNFCAISHTPFDFTLTFCEVMPPTDQDLREGSPDRIMKAPVRARLVVPVQFVPNLVTALNEHMRIYSESYANAAWVKGPVH